METVVNPAASPITPQIKATKQQLVKIKQSSLPMHDG
jgi:hypothetical protein